MTCEKCIYKKCLLRTKKDFLICPVEALKQKHEKTRKNK